MKKHIKKLWIAALRSGKYNQTTGGLHNNVGFCCLGVLCDLHRKKMKKKGWIKIAGNDYSYNGKLGYLPDTVQKWAGLKSNNPIVSFDDVGYDSLSNCNDAAKKNFSWIANAIEKEL